MKHGMSRTREHQCWRDMKQRCYNPRNKHFKDYGGRNIRVCDIWHTFGNFYSDMGKKPNGATLERIDNEGNYEPLNCCWATPKEQAQNRRRRKTEKLTDAQRQEIRGIYSASNLSQKMLADMYGVSQTLVSYIILGNQRT